MLVLSDHERVAVEEVILPQAKLEGTTQVAGVAKVTVATMELSSAAQLAYTPKA